MSYLNPGATAGQIDLVQPVNWLHPLNRGLRAWLLFLPGLGLSSVAPDLTRIHSLGCHGTLTGGAIPGSAHGRPGGWGSWDLDGTNDYLSIAQPLNLRRTAGALTVTTWMRPDFDTSGANRTWFQWGLASGEDPRFFLRYESGASGWLADGTSLSLGRTDGNFTWTVGDWFHIAYTHTGLASSGQFYKNGLAVATSNNPDVTPDPATFTIARLGHYIDAQPRAFDGQLDDFRFYDRALPAIEIKQLYDASRHYYEGVLQRTEPAWVLSQAGTAGAGLIDSVLLGRRRLVVA